MRGRDFRVLTLASSFYEVIIIRRRDRIKVRILLARKSHQGETLGFHRPSRSQVAPDMGPYHPLC